MIAATVGAAGLLASWSDRLDAIWWLGVWLAACRVFIWACDRIPPDRDE